MSTRKQFETSLQLTPELERLIKEAQDKGVTEADLQEQRVSFAYGNALKSEHITKETVRRTSQSIRLKID
jgi:hypothetical protein